MLNHIERWLIILGILVLLWQSRYVFRAAYYVSEVAKRAHELKLAPPWLVLAPVLEKEKKK